MRRLEIVQIVKNVSSSWVALGTNVVVGFFLWPIIVHRLGDDAAGVWVLIFSITGYYGLFDLGIRSSVIRYVSRAKATEDKEGASRVVSTSLFSYTCIGAAAFLITVAASLYIGKFQGVGPEFRTTAGWLLLMAGSAVSLGFPLGVAGGVLEGLQRFDAQRLPNTVATLLRAGLIIIALRHGYGLLMVTFITVAMPLLASMVCAVIAWRLLRVPLGLRYVERATFREMATYSGTTLIIIVSSRLRFKSDSIIIGAFLSAAAITYFNIGARIVDYAGEVVENLAQLFLPMSSHADARGDQDRLRKILVAGNRFCAFTIFPLCAVLIVLGKSIITVWIGARYVEQSYPVLLILLLATTLMLAQAASPRVLFGMAKHRTWAIVTLIEGVVNVILSMILVRPYGIVGDALGTAIPLAATMIFFLPQHVCGKLQVPVRTFLREAYVLPLLVCAPLVATLLLMKRWFIPHTYGQLAIHLLVAGAVYGCVLGWAVFSKRATKVGRLIVSEEDLLEAAGAAAAAETTSLDI